MIRYEIKKIFSKTICRISMIVLLLSLIISCYFAITNITYIDEQGVSHTGIAAARDLRTEKQKWEGTLDEEALQKVLDEYRKINEEYPIRQGDYTANMLHDSKVQGISEIKDMINIGFCEFRDFNYYRIDSVSKDEVGKLYENRVKSLEKWLGSEDAEGLFDENEKAFLLERYGQLKAPLYYEDYDGWRSVLHYAQTIVMLVMLVSAFLVSGIFSNEFSWKADSIFFSTKYGRDKGTKAKLTAGGNGYLLAVYCFIFHHCIRGSRIWWWKCNDTNWILVLEVLLQYYLCATVCTYHFSRLYWNIVLYVTVYAYICENTYSSSGGYYSICYFVFTIILVEFPLLRRCTWIIPRPIIAD